jgi:membrane-associated phospholipid phosphatase
MIRAMPQLFYRLPQNVVNIFSGRNILWQALAVVLTIVIVMSGFDWSYYLSTRGEMFIRLARPALRLGMLMPVLGSLVILIVGEAAKNRRAITTAWALGQAALLAYLIVSGYKAITGRRPPPFHGSLRAPALNVAALTDSSHGFQFGFLKGGIFWGWPSGHATVAFPMAFCLIMLCPKNKAVLFLALLYAFYIGLGVSVTIHWFSEFVAGAIIGSVIGTAVGTSFKTKLVPLAA